MVQLKPEYRNSDIIWQQQVDAALTHEEAQTQLLYTLNVQLFRFRTFAHWAVGALVVLALVGVIVLAAA